MPSRQRGSVIRRGKTWAVRYYDDAGARRFQGGFETRSEALDWLEHRLDEVRALRRGDRVRPSERLTVSEICTGSSRCTTSTRRRRGRCARS
jgi:hypothetical protein